MNILTESAYTESKTLRDRQIVNLSDEKAEEILVKIKSLYFALWQGEGTTTTSALSKYYEVSVETIQKVIQRHREELKSDGLKSIRGKALKGVADSLSISKKTPQLTIWTPRAALRLGMLLRDSSIAIAVRTSLLNAVEKVIPAQAIEIEKLKLQLQVAEAQAKAAIAQERLLAASSALAIINPALPALVLGNPDAVITKTETIEKTVLVNEQGRSRVSYEGLSKTKLAKRYGFKKASDFVNWLRSVGREDILKPGLIATPCQYISFEQVAELDRIWSSRSGSRQILIGE